jgi:hypothetical protein
MIDRVLSTAMVTLRGDPGFSWKDSVARPPPDRLLAEFSGTREYNKSSALLLHCNVRPRRRGSLKIAAHGAISSEASDR